MSRVGLVLLLYLATATSAGAQAATTMTTPLAPPFRTSKPHRELGELTSTYNAGDWRTLQRRAKEFVDDARNNAPDPVKAVLDLRRNYIALTWIDHDSLGKTVLMRFVAHEPAPDRFSADLPGIAGDPSGAASGSGFYELLLARSADAAAASVYVSTREADPLSEALPGFIQALAGPLFGTTSTLLGQEAAARPAVFATVSRVELPFRRATVALKSSVRDPWFDEAAFRKGLPELAAKVRFDDVPNSSCARSQVTTLRLELKDATSKCPGKEAVACLDERLAAEYNAALASCDGGKPSEADVAALQLVDKRFREYVRNSVINSAQTEQTFRNRPPTRFALGAGTAVMVSARLSRPRVKLEDGLLIADPLTRVMTMAFVNWSPRGYRPDAPSVTAGERIRLQFGAVLTPDFGAMAGVNVLLARGIGVSGGIAALFAKGAREEEIGAKPADAKDPFRLSLATAPFVGITYNYK